VGRRRGAVASRGGVVEAIEEGRRKLGRESEIEGVGTRTPGWPESLRHAGLLRGPHQITQPMRPVVIGCRLVNYSTILDSQQLQYQLISCAPLVETIVLKCSCQSLL
jgi:hypothetical protein